MKLQKETPAALAGAVGAQKKIQLPEERIANSFHANKKKALEILSSTTLPQTSRRGSQ